jgi:hypothetical protein
VFQQYICISTLRRFYSLIKPGSTQVVHCVAILDPLTQKPPRFPSTACAVALRLPRGLLRRAVLERSLSLLATGRNAFR